MELLLAIIIFIIVVSILWNIAKWLIKFAVILFIFYMVYQIIVAMPGL